LATGGSATLVAAAESDAAAELPPCLGMKAKLGWLPWGKLGLVVQIMFSSGFSRLAGGATLRKLCDEDDEDDDDKEGAIGSSSGSLDAVDDPPMSVF
jgi:hypothetical protein